MRKILLSVATVGMAATLFLKYYPNFGSAPNAKKQSSYLSSHNYEKKKFHNLYPTIIENDVKFLVSVLKDYLRKNPNLTPAHPLKTQPFNWGSPPQSKTRVTWFGHSTVLLELDGKRIFIDPMLGSSPSPFPQLGGKRYSPGLPFELDSVPSIDIVLYSHDHYDHLDHDSVKLLKDKVRQFIVPLGVGSRLEGWGVPAWKIQELDWWDSLDHAGIRFISTPARHFSGRSLFDHDSTLWTSWVIQHDEMKIFFNGDSGYGPHFKEIGDQYGPFDFTMMECGQYDKRWAPIHMMPEETVQAHIDLKGNLMMPIHWAAFTLAFNEWTDSIERVTKAADESGIAITTPKIGQSVLLGSGIYPTEKWWESNKKTLI